MHAASVGEVKILGYLLQYLRSRRPALDLHVSVMTRAGYATACNLAGRHGPGLTVSCFPFDSPPTMSRTFDAVAPKILLVAETEIWPNLIREASRRHIPIILVNGRMSERAFRAYRFVRPSLSGILARYERFCVKTAADADRYRYFGVPEDKVVVTGDMKFDAPLVPRSNNIRRRIRASAGVTDEQFLFVAGSTRPGEEALLARVFREMSKDHVRLRMIVAPRHVERVSEIMQALRQHGLPCAAYGGSTADARVTIVDRMGLLNDLYLAADLAFVGGTLADFGGHNLLEPVWAGTPVIFGPSVSNVAEAANYILAHNYGRQVQTADELAELLQRALNGKLSVSVKTEHDLRHSATAAVGDYVMERLTRA